MSLGVLLRRGCFLFSNEAQNEEREGEGESATEERERERDIYKMSGMVYVVDRVLPEENRKESEKRFNIPIIYKNQEKKKKQEKMIEHA